MFDVLFFFNCDAFTLYNSIAFMASHKVSFFPLVCGGGGGRHFIVTLFVCCRKLHILNNMTCKHAFLVYAVNRRETLWTFNYSNSHLVHHDLPRGNGILSPFLPLSCVFRSTFATNPTNLSWMSCSAVLL